MTNEKKMKIAKIVNDFTFIITGGSDNDLYKGDKLVIVQPGNLDILDPDTGDVIGQYTIKKGYLVVNEVYNNFSICKSETYQEEVPTNSFSTFTSSLNGNSYKTVTKYKKLNVNKDDVTGGLTPDPIEVGDIVEKVSS